jgi:hypothetical protein
MSETKEKESAFERIIKPWWAKLVAGVLVIFMACLSYNDFGKLESGEKESLLVGRSTKIFYDLGGKGLATAVPVIGGLCLIGWGAVQRSRKGRE